MTLAAPSQGTQGISGAKPNSSRASALDAGSRHRGTSPNDMTQRRAPSRSSRLKGRCKWWFGRLSE